MGLSVCIRIMFRRLKLDTKQRLFTYRGPKGGPTLIELPVTRALNLLTNYGRDGASSSLARCYNEKGVTSSTRNAQYLGRIERISVLESVSRSPG